MEGRIESQNRQTFIWSTKYIAANLLNGRLIFPVNYAGTIKYTQKSKIKLNFYDT